MSPRFDDRKQAAEFGFKPPAAATMRRMSDLACKADDRGCRRVGRRRCIADGTPTTQMWTSGL